MAPVTPYVKSLYKILLWIIRVAVVNLEGAWSQPAARSVGNPSGRGHGRHFLRRRRLRPGGKRAVVHVIGRGETGAAAEESGV